MRVLLILSICLLASTGALAAPGGAPAPEKSPPSSPSMTPREAAASGPRVEAEQIYAVAYDEVDKAKKDAEGGKAKNAEKKFKRALERAERAVALDPNYHEAWNILGYCARKLGDFPRALSAYDKCLAIKFDYVPAREYLGEAYVERGEVGKARAQLAILEKLGATEEAGELREQIEAYEKAHPAAAATADSSAAAPMPADSTAGSAGH